MPFREMCPGQPSTRHARFWHFVGPSESKSLSWKARTCAGEVFVSLPISVVFHAREKNNKLPSWPIMEWFAWMRSLLGSPRFWHVLYRWICLHGRYYSISVTIMCSSETPIHVLIWTNITCVLLILLPASGHSINNVLCPQFRGEMEPHLYSVTRWHRTRDDSVCCLQARSFLLLGVRKFLPNDIRGRGKFFQVSITAKRLEIHR